MEEDNFSSLDGGNGRLAATIVEKGADTRTTLRDNPTHQKMEVRWRAGDAIGVFGSVEGTNVRYETSEASISKDGKTTVFETTATAAQGNLMVYYPYQQGAARATDGALELTMPATQLYVTEQTGIAQPHPAANMMAGKGKDGKIAFRNLFAILRINIAGGDGEVVKRVLFTDLSGRPVSGSFSVRWSGDIPTAEFPQTGSGNDLQIELDCEDGVALANNSLVKFYLIVPAREYEKGFRVDFELTNGEKITKTIGATTGKILLRNMLYPIGDMFPNQDDKVSYKLAEDVTIMDDERYDLIREMSIDTASYLLTLKVDEGFAPRVGERLIINQTSSVVPKGYVGYVKSVNGQSVVLFPTKNLGDVFEELSIGNAVWSAGGAIEDGGYAVDLSQYITSIETADGTTVQFVVDGSDVLMQMPIPFAEAEVNTKISLPTLSHTTNFVDQNNPENECQLGIAVQMDLGLYLHILVRRWTLEEVHCRVNPTIKITSEVSVDWLSAAYGTEIPFIVVRCAPIPAGPVMIIPMFEFYLTFDIEGKIGLVAELVYTQEFSAGAMYKNKQMSCYAETVGDAANKSPFAFNQKVQVEGGVSVGIAPKVGFSLWEIIRLNTRLYTKVKGAANLNFDFSADTFDGSLYNGLSKSKMYIDLLMYLEGGVFGWKDYEIATSKTSVLKSPIWEAYFVPSFREFKIRGYKEGLDIKLIIENKLFYKSVIGLNFYGLDEETDEYTVPAGSMTLCDYEKPPTGTDYYYLQELFETNLPPGLYEARVTARLDTPKDDYTVESDVKALFSVQSGVIVLQTDKNIGEKIMLIIGTDYEHVNGVWIDLNNNGIEDEEERKALAVNVGKDYTIQSKTISIYGDISKFQSPGNKLTSIELNNCRLLEELSVANNLLTTLDVSSCKALEELNCANNKFTSLDVSSCTVLESLKCDDNQLTTFNVSSKELINLSCRNNQLAVLDVSGFNLLKRLDCAYNQLTALDVSNCRDLVFLDCSKNKLTKAIDVSNFKALNELRCIENQITSLNASGCTALKKLRCNYNEISLLNISGCTALELLYCHENKITSSLDVSGFKNLKDLRCYRNQIPSLKANGCISLRLLEFYSNKVALLDISGCIALESLKGASNRLTTLDASGCVALHTLECEINNLTLLDATGCTALKTISCFDNQLTTMLVEDCKALNSLMCYNNQLTGVRPDYFDNIEWITYDIRYKYKWGYDAESDSYKYVVETDNKKGYWYAHEPEGGCHSPEPCN